MGGEELVGRESRQARRGECRAGVSASHLYRAACAQSLHRAVSTPRGSLVMRSRAQAGTGSFDPSFVAAGVLLVVGAGLSLTLHEAKDYHAQARKEAAFEEAPGALETKVPAIQG